MNTSTVILKNCKSFVLKDEYKKGAFYTDTRVVYMYKYKLMTVLKHGQDWSILKADKIPSMERRGGWHKGHPFLKSNEKLLCGKKISLFKTGSLCVGQKYRNIWTMQIGLAGFSKRRGGRGKYIVGWSRSGRSWG